MQTQGYKKVATVDNPLVDQNIYGNLAASVAGRLADLRKASIREGLEGLLKEEHRIERVAFVRGVEFINDSKATNINSAWYALESINKPIIWIAGGQDNGNDYGPIAALVKQKVKAIICLGKDNSSIVKAFEKTIELIFETHSMEDAVKSAYLAANPGYVVLLSPACASFDLFENFEERGNQFKKAVLNL
jgi:UDP-N-acetylmuramoylalanine--D-glutamate ligase